MFFDGSKFRKQFLKRVTKGTILWNNFKIWRAVSEGKNFEEFLWSPQSAKSLPPHPPPPMAAMFLRRIKISPTIFEKCHTRNNLVKLFQILTSGFGEKDFLRISSCPYSAKSPPPPTAAMFLDGSKFREQFLKRVTQGTFLWNYFKIRPGVSEKIF